MIADTALSTGRLLTTATLTAAATLALMPLVVRYLRSAAVLDLPGARSSHTVPTPRGGGLGIVAPFLGAFVIAGRPELGTTLTVGAALLGLAVVGYIDDRHSLGSTMRLASVLALGAAVTTSLSLTWWVMIAGTIAFAATVNAFNFMDGINGISAGTMMLAGLTFALGGADVANRPLTYVGVGLAAVGVGFLPFNFPSAQVFLGDVGSYFAGGTIAVGSLMSWQAGLPLLVVAGPVLLYAVDTAVTLARRVRRGERWDEAHREHIYQRVAAATGHPASTAMSFVLGATICGAGLASLRWSVPWTAQVAVVLGSVGIYMASPRIVGARSVPAEGRLRVLLMTLIFPPDGVSSAQLLGEIVEDLSASGDDVQVITTSPHYNTDPLAQELQPITWRWHRLVGTSRFGDVAVTHIRMPKKASGRIGRMGQWAWFHLASGALALARSSSYDVLFAVSPPPTVATVASFLKRVNGTPFVYAVWELYPEILVKLDQIQEGSATHRLLQRLERHTYRAADRVAVLHQPMADAVLATLPGAAAKTTIVPTFADTEFLRPLPSETALRKQHHMDERFVVGYAGNLGISQDLSSALRGASRLPADEVGVLICGDGNDRARLEALVEDEGIHNVEFAGHLPYERVPEIIASSDLSLVVLSGGIGAEALPSKVYRIMACGRPVLAISNPGSALHEFVTAEGVGLTAESDSPETVAKAIEWAIANPADLDQMARRARELAEERFSRTAVTTQYRELLVAARNGNGGVDAP